MSIVDDPLLVVVMVTGTDDKFPLGDVWLTPLVRARKIDWIDLVRRHVTGDFGKFGHFDAIGVTADEIARGCLATDDDAKLNKIAVLKGRGRVLSVYDEYWVVTESNGKDVETTVLLGEED